MEFLKIVLPVVAGLLTAIWGVIKYFSDRSMQAYSEHINNLFSEDKKIVLSTIATLDFFRNDKRYKANVIDILINRLYTELDFEIVNAIITELSQVSNTEEFRYISQKFLDINRNFELQSAQVSRRYEVLQADNKRTLEKYNLIANEDKIKDEESKFVIQSEQITKSYETLTTYQLNWHKQIVGEAFAMLMLEASRKGITEKLDIKLFENNMIGIHLFDFQLKHLRILYAAFEDASLQELEIGEISFEHVLFENTLIRRCRFNKGFVSNIEFVNVKFDWVTFTDISFEDVYFIGVEFNNCRFENVQGINEKLFYNCTVVSEGKTTNSTIDFSKIKNTRSEVEEVLDKSNRSLWGRRYIKAKLMEQEESAVVSKPQNGRGALNQGSRIIISVSTGSPARDPALEERRVLCERPC